MSFSTPDQLEENSYPGDDFQKCAGRSYENDFEECYSDDFDSDAVF